MRDHNLLSYRNTSLVYTIWYAINIRITSKNKGYQNNQNIRLHYLYCKDKMWSRICTIFMYYYESGIKNIAITVNHFLDGSS